LKAGASIHTERSAKSDEKNNSRGRIVQKNINGLTSIYNKRAQSFKYLILKAMELAKIN